MDEMSIQEGIDYIRGKFRGLEAMLAITRGTFDQDDREFLIERFNGLVNTATRINIEANVLGDSSPHTEPFYRGITDAVEGVTNCFNRDSEEGNP